MKVSINEVLRAVERVLVTMNTHPDRMVASDVRVGLRVSATRTEPAMADVFGHKEILMRVEVDE